MDSQIFQCCKNCFKINLNIYLLPPHLVFLNLRQHKKIVVTIRLQPYSERYYSNYKVINTTIFLLVKLTIKDYDSTMDSFCPNKKSRKKLTPSYCPNYSKISLCQHHFDKESKSFSILILKQLFLRLILIHFQNGHEGFLQSCILKALRTFSISFNLLHVEVFSIAVYSIIFSLFFVSLQIFLWFYIDYVGEMWEILSLFKVYKKTFVSIFKVNFIC